MHGEHHIDAHSHHEPHHHHDAEPDHSQHHHHHTDWGLIREALVTSRLDRNTVKHGRHFALLAEAKARFTAWRPMMTGLMLLTAFYFLLKTGATPPMSRQALLYGLCAGLALVATVAVKVQYAVALPVLGLFASWVAARLGARSLQARFIGGLALGGGMIALLLMLYNWSAFGSPVSTGYGADLQGTLKTPLYEGLFGLLFSSGKGLWLYAPPIFLGIIGWSAFFRRQRAVGLAILGVALPTLLLFALYRFWPGDGAWGPRYLVPLLPFVMLPAAGLGYANPYALPTTRRWLRPPRLALLVVGICGLAVNFLGAAVNFDTYINVVNDDATRYWYPETSPVRGHWVLLNQRLDEWRCRLGLCSDGVLLREGFSYSEGDKFLNDLFPRWTHGHVAIGLPDEPVTVTLRLADHRPPPLPRAEVTLSAQDGQVTSQSRVPAADEPVASVLTATVQPVDGARPTLILDIPTWNPHEVADSPRNEDLGLMIEKMSVSDTRGKRLNIQEALPMEQYYAAPRWYYNPSSHHPLDLWAWYINASGQQLRLGFLTLAVLLPALGAIWWSAPALLRRLRPTLRAADV